MLKTLQNTWRLMKVSWSVLNEDRRVLLLPLASGIAVVMIVAAALGVFAGLGFLDDSGISAGEYVVGAGFYLAATFAVIYFNAALVSIAHARLQGGKPTIAFGIHAANANLPAIFGWACFATTIGLILEQLRQGEGLAFKIVGWILSAIWAYATFFVVPVLVIEGLSPFQAIKRSTQLIQETWGKQLVSNWSFALIYIALFAAAIIPLVAVASVSGTLAIVVGVLFTVPLLAVGIATITAMEGIFRTALFMYATDSLADARFGGEMLRRAYVTKESRGTSWQ